MNFTVGHAFNLEDLFLGFKSRNLISDSKSLKILYGDEHKKKLSTKVFKEACKIIIKDIIENDVEFQLPTGKKKTSLKMQRKDGLDFQIARQRGAFREIDFLASDFSAYLLCFYMYGNRALPKTKPVYLNKAFKEEITNKTNQGQVWYGRSIKTISDYYEEIFKLFPIIPLQDIVKILKFGWRSVYLHNSYGGDTVINDHDFWFYIGSAYKDSIKYFKYYIKKLSVKLKIMFFKKHLIWDGYYYFGLTQKLYELYLSQIKVRGRKRKYFKFNKIVFYKLFDICNIQNSGSVCIMKVSLKGDFGYTYYREKCELQDCEVFLLREPLKFEDVLITNYKYAYL